MDPTETVTRPEPATRVLLVGAGAVGQVYGYHLQRGGADVAFLVRPKYAEEARSGFHLYPLHRRRPRENPVPFRGFRVFTSVEEIAAAPWDVVVLCVSTTALRAGDWMANLAEATGDATILGLQPGLEDPAFVRERTRPERLAWGIITMIAYAAPLPGEEVPHPGIAYWLPPLSRFPLSGPEERTRAIAKLFRRGGMRTRVVRDVAPLVGLGGPALNLHIAALECTGWRLDALGRDRALLDLTHSAIREAVAVAAQQLGVRPPFWLRLLRPWLVRLALRLAPAVVPLDLETYLRIHFTKVREQTLLLLDRWADLAEEAGLDNQSLHTLRERLTS
jgi:2-dehydropantoate 2-reductase